MVVLSGGTWNLLWPRGYGSNHCDRRPSSRACPVLRSWLLCSHGVVTFSGERDCWRSSSKLLPSSTAKRLQRNLIQAIGHVFGLSDSILGLTVFALGNSTADLVADYTIAQMGYPVMAISACYGGPLLNILLGIGLSGSFYIAQDHRPYHIHLDPTLMTTGVGLLFILGESLRLFVLKDKA